MLRGLAVLIGVLSGLDVLGGVLGGELSGVLSGLLSGLLSMLQAV